MSEQTETFHIPLEAAEMYEARFVPALFAEWAPRLLDAADVQPGQQVLDVACGTGIVGRTAAERVGVSGSVVGVDLNAAMLTVARRVAPDLEWRSGDVGALPFSAASFDAVLCQMALMFFPDRRRAVSEMARVARPGGRVGICVPASLEDQPAYRVFVDIVGRHAGVEAMSLLGTYWSCGDVDELTRLLMDAGLAPRTQVTTTGTAHFPSIEGFVATEIESTPLADRIGATEYSQIVAEAASELARYETADGRLDVPLVGHVLVGSVPLTDVSRGA